MLCYAMLYRAVPCRVVSCRVVSCRVVSCRVVSCHVMSCHVMSCLSCGVWHFSIHSSRNWLWRYRYFVLIYDMPNMPGQQQPFPTATSCLWTNWILWSRKWHSPSNSYRCMKTISPLGLRWRHIGRDGVSNQQSHDCLLKRIFRRRSKDKSKLCVIGLCAGNSQVTGEFPAQSASNAQKYFLLMTSSWDQFHIMHTKCI